MADTVTGVVSDGGRGVDACIPGTLSASTVGLVDGCGGGGGGGVFVGGVTCGVVSGSVGFTGTSRCSVTRVIVRMNARMRSTPIVRFCHSVMYANAAHTIDAMYTLLRRSRRGRGGECDRKTMYRRIATTEYSSV